MPVPLRSGFLSSLIEECLGYSQVPIRYKISEEPEQLSMTFPLLEGRFQQESAQKTVCRAAANTNTAKSIINNYSFAEKERVHLGCRF